MTKASIELQDLRRRIYLTAKADRDWRFWGLNVHVCKEKTIREAYEIGPSTPQAPPFRRAACQAAASTSGRHTLSLSE